MVNQEIYQGIKYALSKKQTLREAMMSFYNSGYSKAEIEEAARKVQIEAHEAKYGSPTGVKTQPVEEPKKESFFKRLFKKKEKKESSEKPKEEEQVKEVDLLEDIDNKFSKPKEKKTIKPLVEKKESKISPVKRDLSFIKKGAVSGKPLQKISNYEDMKKPRKDWLTIFLIILLLVLVGALVAVFLFKQEILNFFSNLFLK